jgi:hypothetical protein
VTIAEVIGARHVVWHSTTTTTGVAEVDAKSRAPGLPARLERDAAPIKV